MASYLLRLLRRRPIARAAFVGFGACGVASTTWSPIAAAPSSRDLFCQQLDSIESSLDRIEGSLNGDSSCKPARHRFHSSIDGSTLCVVQWNVYEDGLAEQPTAIGFDPAFRRRFDTLCAELSRDHGSGPYRVFAETRDFGELPDIVALDSLAR